MIDTTRARWAVVTAGLLSLVPAAQAQRMMPTRTPQMRPGMSGMTIHQAAANAAVAGRGSMLNPFGFGNPYAGRATYSGWMLNPSSGYAAYPGAMSMPSGQGAAGMNSYAPSNY